MPTDFSATCFQEQLQQSLDAVCVKARQSEGLGNADWTKEQWIQLGGRLAQKRLRGDGHRFWIGFRGAKTVFKFPPSLQVGGEWLYDFAFIEYFKDGFGELLVAAESEWDKQGTGFQDDLEKLLVTKARFRVFLCDPGWEDHHAEDVLRLVQSMISTTVHLQEDNFWLVIWRSRPSYSLHRLLNGELHLVTPAS